MPKRPRAHIIEDLARAHLHRAFAEVGWSSEDLDQDYGEDILVRIFDDGTATPWSFFVQSKGTDRLHRYVSRGGHSISFPIHSTHLEHWDRFWEPVVLAIYDASTDTTYWEVIQTYVESLKTSDAGKPRQSIPVHVPTDNLLDAEGLQRLRSRTKSRFQRFQAQKEGADILIDELKKQWGVDIDYGPEFGVLILPKGGFQPDPSGARTVTAFGQFAAQLQRFKDKYGMDPQKAFEGSIDVMSQIVMAYADGGKLQVRDKDGAIVEEWETLEELKRHVERKAELDEE